MIIDASMIIARKSAVYTLYNVQQLLKCHDALDDDSDGMMW